MTDDKLDPELWEQVESLEECKLELADVLEHLWRHMRGDHSLCGEVCDWAAWMERAGFALRKAGRLP